MPTQEFRWWFLPYCLEKIENNKYVVLNRAYKPLGLLTNERVDYDLYAVKIRMTAEMAKSLSFSQNTDVDKVYLYDDSCVPTSGSGHMTKYLERVAKLASYEIVV